MMGDGGEGRKGTGEAGIAAGRGTAEKGGVLSRGNMGGGGGGGGGGGCYHTKLSELIDWCGCE